MGAGAGRVPVVQPPHDSNMLLTWPWEGRRGGDVSPAGMEGTSHRGGLTLVGNPVAHELLHTTWDHQGVQFRILTAPAKSSAISGDSDLHLEMQLGSLSNWCGGGWPWNRCARAKKRMETIKGHGGYLGTSTKRLGALIPARGPLISAGCPEASSATSPVQTICEQHT